MSKVYEAILRARTDQDLARRVERGATKASLKTEIAALEGLPPLRMEKEMGRLFHNVAGLLPNSTGCIIQFIGSQEDEGTSTIMREFGLFLAAKANKAILLVDADRARLPQHRALGIPAKISLEWIMNEGGAVDEAICRVKNSRVFLCQLYEEAGEGSRSCSMLDQSDLWNKLRKGFDFILVDSSPMGSSDEAFTFCSTADGIILVAEAEKTRARVVSNLKSRVLQSGGNILGLVFNKQRYYIPDWLYKRL